MPYCSNCGQLIEEKAKFCSSCGTPHPAQQTPQEEKRKTVYEGKIRKCPNCGENLSSLTAICPACGHEFSSVQVDEDLYEFSKRIDAFDDQIARLPKVNSRTGWASWSTGWRIGWVVLNVYTLCIPLFFYAIVRLFKKFSFELTPEERNKAAFIENYVFPNEREAIIEALFFIKTKITFLAGEPANRNTMHWANIWSNKATTIYAKASIVLHGDTLSERTFAEIQNEKKRIANKCIWRPAITIGVVATLIIAVCIIGGIKNSIKHNTKLVLPDAMPYSLLPMYEPMYGEITSDNEDKLKISLYQTDAAVYDSYVQGCVDNGFVVDAEKKTASYKAYNETGYHITVTYNKKATISVVIESPMDFHKITWPTSGVAALIPAPPSVMGSISTNSASSFTAYIANITREQYDAYVDTCMGCGFDIDYNRYDDSFNAENKEGIDISLLYRGGNVMYVRLYGGNYSHSQIRSIIDKFNEQMDEVKDMWNGDGVTTDNDSSTKATEPSAESSEPRIVDGATETLNVKNFSLEVPIYYEEEGSKNEYLQYYAEKGDKVVMLSIAYPEESDDNYDVSFKGLEADDDNMVKAVAGMFTDGDVIDHEVFESDYGVKGILYHFTYKQKIDWHTKVDGGGYCFCFPSESDRRWFYVVLLHTNNVSSNDYKDDYMSMLAGIKEK